MTAKTNKELQSAYRNRKHADGLYKVRGIYAAKPLHGKIKDMAHKIAKQVGE